LLSGTWLQKGGENHHFGGRRRTRNQHLEEAMIHTRNALALCTAGLLSMAAAGCMGASMGPADVSTSAMLNAADRGEIEEGQLALQQATSPTVRQFAQQMVTEHTNAMNMRQQMMQNMGMTQMAMDAMMSDPAARAVTDNHMAAMQMLRSAQRGMSFDQAYMQRQVAVHGYLIQALDAMNGNSGMAMSGSGMSSSGMSGSSMGSSGMSGSSGTSDGMMSGSGTSGSSMDMSHMTMTDMRMSARATIASHLAMAQQIMGSMGNMGR
jgi:predicted outer membrane protein